jgi:hypothetical protein
MRNISDKSCKENQNTHFMSSNFFLDNRAVCETMSKNSIEPGMSHLTIWRMRIACWIPKATNIHSEYVIPIRFPQQQWLHERASLCHYMYIACRVTLLFVKPSTPDVKYVTFENRI